MANCHFSENLPAVNNHRRVMAGRGAAPKGAPRSLAAWGDEGTRPARNGSTRVVFAAAAGVFYRFLAIRFTPGFFVAGVVAPLMSLIFETTPSFGANHS